MYILKNVFKDWRITQGYGLTEFAKAHPDYYRFGIHTGIDFAAPIGALIRAAHNGVVVKDDDLGYTACGIYVTIWDTEQDIATRYYHMRRNLVERGELVKVGDVIGEEGSTGLSTGPHTHFEIVATLNGYLDYSNPYAGKGATIDPFGKYIEWEE